MAINTKSLKMDVGRSNMKKEVDSLTTYKRIFCGELLIMGVIFLVIGLLFIFGIIQVQDWKKWTFTILTLGGGFWLIIDLIWTLKSEKRRKKNALIDKFLTLPSGLAMIVLDIIALIHLIQDPTWIGFNDINFFQYVIGGNITFVSLVFIFEGIYHYFVIHPAVYEIMEEEKKEAEKEALKIKEQEENNLDK